MGSARLARRTGNLPPNIPLGAGGDNLKVTRYYLYTTSFGACLNSRNEGPLDKSPKMTDLIQ